MYEIPLQTSNMYYIELCDKIYVYIYRHPMSESLQLPVVHHFTAVMQHIFDLLKGHRINLTYMVHMMEFCCLY